MPKKGFFIVFGSFSANQGFQKSF